MPENSQPGRVNVARPGRRAYHTDLSPEERRDRARLASNARWAKTPDRQAATRAARAAASARFYEAADALGITDELEREMLAASARRAHAARMRLVQSRRRRLAAAASEAAEQAGEAV